MRQFRDFNCKPERKWTGSKNNLYWLLEPLGPADEAAAMRLGHIFSHAAECMNPRDPIDSTLEHVSALLREQPLENSCIQVGVVYLETVPHGMVVHYLLSGGVTLLYALGDHDKDEVFGQLGVYPSIPTCQLRHSACVALREAQGMEMDSAWQSLVAAWSQSKTSGCFSETDIPQHSLHGVLRIRSPESAVVMLVGESFKDLQQDGLLPQEPEALLYQIRRSPSPNTYIGRAYSALAKDDGSQFSKVYREPNISGWIWWEGVV